MKRIKQVIRKNLPETNSSSSHSVVICVDPNSLVDTLPMDSEGVIHVPRRSESFGWEYEKYNDPMTLFHIFVLLQDVSDKEIVCFQHTSMATDFC